MNQASITAPDLKELPPTARALPPKGPPHRRTIEMGVEEPRQILEGSVRQSVQRRSPLGHPHRCGLLLHAHYKQNVHSIHRKSLVNGRQT